MGKVLHFEKTTLKPYPFQGTPDDHLINSYVVWINNSPLIRTGIVDTEQKVKDLLGIAREVHGNWQRALGKEFPLRVCSDQLNSVEFEWGLTHHQHQAMIHAVEQLGAELVHLNTPLDHFFSEKPDLIKVHSVLEALDQMPKLLNSEGWARICAWYNEGLDQAFKQFPYDAIEEYTLESYINAFGSEVNSLYLNRALQHLLVNQLALGSLDNPVKLDFQKSVEREKDVLQVRARIQKLLVDHLTPLRKLTSVIPVIEDVHPELISIKRTGRYLQTLLEHEVSDLDGMSWGKQEMVLQLLLDAMRIIPAINCQHGLDRTHLSFAIRCSLMQMKEDLEPEALDDLVLNWDEKTFRLNRLVAKQGIQGLKDPSVDPSLQHVIQIRERIYYHLKKCCRPITELSRKGSVPKWKENEYEHPSSFDFLPSHIDGVQLVEYDFEKGIPITLTDAGHQFFLTFLFQLNYE